MQMFRLSALHPKALRARKLLVQQPLHLHLVVVVMWSCHMWTSALKNVIVHVELSRSPNGRFKSPPDPGGGFRSKMPVAQPLQKRNGYKFTTAACDAHSLTGKSKCPRSGPEPFTTNFYTQTGTCVRSRPSHAHPKQPGR